MIRRAGSIAVAALMLAGCEYSSTPDPTLSARDAEYISMVPAAASSGLNYERYQVDDVTGQPPGTVVVDTHDSLLYFVLPNKKAIRYGVSTGKEAYGWTGKATIKRMAEWPSWMPPADMLKRWPHLKPVVDMGGLKGGPENPLGARALYLYDETGKDTLYRIHGTNEPETIGHGASSGCIRMRNIDVIDLYNRVKVGATVIVL
ncbi:L,D-transpeptidase [Lichenifustis flavocetrariae]|uniref:L,D-transpeptidase n=1 Tax=Lichenifustis flavocetrariae TaxID=2949735 RepID=A0AA42CIU8_9HYPH|nr:L,D-transpeptidase [Lichenifustis flavocetrariae]MCW6508913.1 L,D-transpeptidase [Lichenifustis flavocetrariae]